VKSLRASASLLVVALLAWSARATTFVETGLVPLARAANLVVTGEIDACTSQVVGAERARIVTFCTLMVDVARPPTKGALTDDERAKGALTLAVPGGTHGALAQRVFGAPRFTTGDRVLVLLGPSNGPGGARGVVGLAHGVRAVDASGHLTTAPAFAGTDSHAPPAFDDVATLDALALALEGGP